MTEENTTSRNAPTQKVKSRGRQGIRTRQAGTRLTPSQQQHLLEMLLTKYKAANGGPGHGLSDRQIAMRLGVGFRSVGRYKAEFIKRSPELAVAIRGTNLDTIQNLVGLVSSQKIDVDQVWDPTPPPAPPDPEPKEEKEPKERAGGKKSLEHALSVMRPDGTLSIEQMLNVLSEMATAGPPQYRVQAVKLLDELQAIHRPVESFGPPPPLTFEERVDRLSVLLEVCGREVHDAAFTRVWGVNVEPPLESQEATAQPTEVTPG